MITWLWIGLLSLAVAVLLWWLERAPMRQESMPWGELPDVLVTVFNASRIGAWIEVAPRGSESLVRLERRRGWRKHVLLDVSAPSADRNVMEDYCKENSLRARPLGPRTLRIRVIRREAVAVGKGLVERVLVASGVAPGAALDARWWGKRSPQAMRPLWEAMARRTPIRRGGNFYRRKLSELDERLERGDD